MSNNNGKTLKNYWPLAITVLLIGYVTFLIVILFFSTRQPVNLVTRDYYKQELIYEEQIDRQRNVLALAAKPRLQPSGDALWLTMPVQGTISGEIHFFRPSNARFDKTFPISLDEQFRQLLPTGQLVKGLWRVRITWNDGAKEYFHEEKVVLR